VYYFKIYNLETKSYFVQFPLFSVSLKASVSGILTNTFD